MSLDSKVKSVLKSAELSFELGIINPTRYGPLIHANVPDYVEILLKLIIEEYKLTPKKKDFWGFSDAVEAHLPNPQRLQYSPLGEYFKDIRKDFRNQLHHTDKVQGYIIEQREALLCLIRFNDFIEVVFPNSLGCISDDLNYPCYVNHIQMVYNDSLGLGNHRLYQAVIDELNRLEVENRYICPVDFDSSRLMAVRRLGRYPPEIFSRRVLGFRLSLEKEIVNYLHISTGRKTPRQILLALKKENYDLDTAEVEFCLRFISGKHYKDFGTLVEVAGAASTLQPTYFLEI